MLYDGKCSKGVVFELLTFCFLSLSLSLFLSLSLSLSPFLSVSLSLSFFFPLSLYISLFSPSFSFFSTFSLFAYSLSCSCSLSISVFVLFLCPSHILIISLSVSVSLSLSLFLRLSFSVFLLHSQDPTSLLKLDPKLYVWTLTLASEIRPLTLSSIAPKRTLTWKINPNHLFSNSEAKPKFEC